MKKLREFLKTTLLGGLVVILPTAIMMMIVLWLYGFLERAVIALAQIKDPTITVESLGPAQVIVLGILALLLILAVCFVIGLIIRTQLGKWLHSGLETSLMKRIPGYSLIKETVAQFLGTKKSPFSTVALVRLFDNETLVTGFVTDEHPGGYCTIFMPTGPNPTSGNIYHVKTEQVQIIDVSVEETMRSILSCGAGSGKLLERLKEQA